MLENPHETIVPKGLRHKVGNATRPQPVQRNGIMAYPDCMQTEGMYARGALIPLERQRSGLELPQDSAIGSCKTVQTVRSEDESEAKVGTPRASAVGVCQWQAYRQLPLDAF